MSLRESDWEARLICEMDEIAKKLVDERVVALGFQSAASDDLESYIGRSPHPDLMRAFIRLHDLLSLFDQRSLYACVSSTAFMHNATFLDSLRTSAYIAACVNVAPDERPKKPSLIEFGLAISIYLWVLWVLSTTGYCGWERVQLCSIIPSGK